MHATVSLSMPHAFHHGPAFAPAYPAAMVPASVRHGLWGIEVGGKPSLMGHVAKSAAIGMAAGAAIGAIPLLPPGIVGGALIGGLVGAVAGVVTGIRARREGAAYASVAQHAPPAHARRAAHVARRHRAAHAQGRPHQHPHGSPHAHGPAHARRGVRLAGQVGVNLGGARLGMNISAGRG